VGVSEVKGEDLREKKNIVRFARGKSRQNPFGAPPQNIIERGGKFMFEKQGRLSTQFLKKQSEGS